MINIYDYETLSTDLQLAPIVNVACLTIDEDRFLSDKPFTFLEVVGLAKTMKFDIAEQVEKYGRVITNSTLAWWKEQGPQAIKQISPSSKDVSITELPAFMSSVFTRDEIVFTRGNTFDPVLTTSICKALGVTTPYKWWLDRDTRSFIEGIALGHGIGISNTFTPPNMNEKEFIHHNPAHDVAMDILRIQWILRSVFGKD